MGHQRFPFDPRVWLGHASDSGDSVTVPPFPASGHRSRPGSTGMAAMHVVHGHAAGRAGRVPARAALPPRRAGVLGNEGFHAPRSLLLSARQLDRRTADVVTPSHLIAGTAEHRCRPAAQGRETRVPVDVAVTSNTRSSGDRLHGRPRRTASAPSHRSLITNLPKQRGLSPVNGAVQDGSGAVITPTAPRSSHQTSPTPRPSLQLRFHSAADVEQDRGKS
jgi:hypothetical protein